MDLLDKFWASEAGLFFTYALRAEARGNHQRAELWLGEAIRCEAAE